MVPGACRNKYRSILGLLCNKIMSIFICAPSTHQPTVFVQVHVGKLWGSDTQRDGEGVMGRLDWIALTCREDDEEFTHFILQPYKNYTRACASSHDLGEPGGRLAQPTALTAFIHFCLGVWMAQLLYEPLFIKPNSRMNQKPSDNALQAVFFSIPPLSRNSS